MVFGGNDFFESLLESKLDEKKRRETLRMGVSFLYVNQLVFYTLISKAAESANRSKDFPLIKPDDYSDPEKIAVIIGTPEEFKNKRKYTQDEIETNPELRNEPIYELVKKTEEKTETMRYTPTISRNDWELGEPYIPFELLKEFQEDDELAIQIRWEY